MHGVRKISYATQCYKVTCSSLYIHFEFFFYLLLTFMEVNSVDVINGRYPVRNGGHPIK